ncbi:MAG: hypothetical protein IPJ81_14130 [Chitinophagaceae bacterium]|nr:hypothetical protein [Chitinophagaceae bacterium]
MVNLIPAVKVLSTSGLFTTTDSLGRYLLQVNDEDSIQFIYLNKPTQKFAVSKIVNPAQFDISLWVNYKAKYTTLQKVTVYSKSYRQDSLENRVTYSDIFNFSKPGIKTSIGPGGTAGMDINELINMFRFKRNKQIKSFQKRLEIQEQEKYVSYRFSKNTVRRITNLNPEVLDDFLKKYRPSYEFVANADELEFNQYVLNAFYDYKMSLLKQQDKKEEKINPSN